MPLTKKKEMTKQEYEHASDLIYSLSSMEGEAKTMEEFSFEGRELVYRVMFGEVIDRQ